MPRPWLSSSVEWVSDTVRRFPLLFNCCFSRFPFVARYPTAGSSAQSEAQPFYVNSPYGIVLGHVCFSSSPSQNRKLTLLCLQNGNLTNTDHLQHYLDHYAHRHINTSSDSELLLNLLADALQKTGKFRIDEDDIFRAVREVMQTTSGAYGCTAMIAGYGIFGFRDPNGIRPLGWAKRKSETVEGGWDYMLSSESVVCDALGFSEWTDVNPGSSCLSHSFSQSRLFTLLSHR
jgi:amidophosphoribosyltransferase